MLGKLQALIHLLRWRRQRKAFAQCGEKVAISDDAIIAGHENISFGSHIYIGPRALIYSTRTG